MGKNFWPAYIIVAALLLAATWKFAPVVGEKMPADSRASLRRLVAKCMGRGEETASGAVAPAAPAPAAAPVAGKADVAAPAAKTAPAKAPAAAAPAGGSASAVQTAEDEDDLPSLKGVEPAVPQRAKWGVLNRLTEVVALDGQTKGNVAGGRFFLIEKCETVAKELWLVGDFTPKGFGEKVRVRAKNLHCFTGGPNLLSENQRKCLRMYYQLRGEAQTRKEEVMREAASRSPYAAEAVEAVSAFKAKAKEVENAADTDGEAKRKATYELSQLRSKVQELNEKHRTWKQQHAAELPNPEKDAKYLKLLEDAQQYAEPIAGMAF